MEKVMKQKNLQRQLKQLDSTGWQSNWVGRLVEQASKILAKIGEEYFVSLDMSTQSELQKVWLHGYGVVYYCKYTTQVLKLLLYT